MRDLKMENYDILIPSVLLFHGLSKASMWYSNVPRSLFAQRHRDTCHGDSNIGIFSKLAGQPSLRTLQRPRSWLKDSLDNAAIDGAKGS